MGSRLRNLVLLQIPYLLGASAADVGVRQHAIVDAADQLLDNVAVSYVYGGSELGSSTDCAACNQCLEEKTPDPKARLQRCPTCRQCSLDCSHFTNLVYELAGIRVPYLPTETMLELSAKALRQRFGLIDFGTDLANVQIGDLLVYRGHVVLLEAKQANGRGNIVHATGGRDVRAPGQGLQRERFVPLATFRGPLLRILRPNALLIDSPQQVSQPARLRPVVRRVPAE